MAQLAKEIPVFLPASFLAHTLARLRPLPGMLLPLALVPLASCAQDTYLAQNYQTAPPTYQQSTYAAQPPSYANTSGQFLAPPQVAELVARIALYPDDLVGIILPASTYPLQIVQAARYLDAVRGNATLAPDDSWDNSVVALLNYPDVVNMMNRDLEWTERLGQAVILQQADVIAAIGDFRSQAQAAGNLRTDERQVVEYEQGAIRIRPANPQVIYVPQYEPTRVIVYQNEPVFRYYPRPCPVYHYNYSAGYPSGFSNFWGVSTLFTIGWSSRSVYLHDYDYYDDPRFDRPYGGRFYRRSRHDWHDGDGDHDHRWRDDDRHGGREVAGPQPPREREWRPRGGHGPRPMGLGNDSRDRGEDGRGRGSRDANDGGRPGMQPLVPFVPPSRAAGVNDGPRRGAGSDARISDPPQDRRFSRPMPPRENIAQPEAAPRSSGFSTRTAPRQVAPRNIDPPQDARFSRPLPSRNEQAPIRRTAPSSLVGPTRSSRGDDNARSMQRQVAPARSEAPNASPTRHFQISAPPAREAPSRQDARSSLGSRANSRNDAGPTPSRRNSSRDDDNRGRGNRDR